MAAKSRKIGEFVIESGTTPPARQSTRPFKYPFIQMKAGESVFIPGKTAGALRGSIQYAALKTQAEFVARSEDGGVRVWRTN